MVLFSSMSWYFHVKATMNWHFRHKTACIRSISPPYLGELDTMIPVYDINCRLYPSSIGHASWPIRHTVPLRPKATGVWIRKYDPPYSHWRVTLSGLSYAPLFLCAPHGSWVSYVSVSLRFRQNRILRLHIQGPAGGRRAFINGVSRCLMSRTGFQSMILPIWEKNACLTLRRPRKMSAKLGVDDGCFME